MNPALALLFGLSLLGLATRRLRPVRGEAGGRWRAFLREAGVPWVLCGLAATLLLAPALAIPDGVPSPAASLASLPPWQGVADPAAGNPQLRDLTLQIRPWLLFLRHELRHGRMPYWNPHQLSGTPFWANGQSAPLFPLHLLFALLPVQLGLVLLPWLRLVVGGCGAWALARELGTSHRAAAVAAVAFPLSGTITSFALFPMGNALALVPWVFWATERLAAGRSGWVPMALAGGLQLLGGHPETAIFTGLLAVLYLLVRGGERPWRVWSAFTGAWVAAAALSAVETLPFAATLVASSRWLAAGVPQPIPLAVIGELLLRLVLPELHGNPALGTWWGPFNYPATAVYAGAVTLPLAALGAATGLRVLGRRASDGARDRRWAALVAVTLFALLAAYQVPGVRGLLLALPFFDKSLTHYLKLGVELGLALLAARGLDAWIAGEGRRVLVATTGTVLALLALAWGLFGGAGGGHGSGGPWRAHGLLATEAAWSAGIAAMVVALAACAFLAPARRRALALALPALLAADLALAHARTNPGLSLAKLYPPTGATRFLTHRPGRVAATGGVLHPDAATVYGLDDVRGDTPIELHRYQVVYARLAADDPLAFRPVERWRSPWLDRLGVRWVMTGPGEPPPVAGWRLAYDGKDARVFERPGAPPLVRWASGGRRGQGDELTVSHRAPGSWLVAWRAHERRMLLVAETWDPGWHARIDGRPAPIRQVDGILMGIEVGPGQGTLELTYRPVGIVWGAALSLLGAAACAAGAWRRAAESPPPP